jgi:hypothetical protein
MVASVGLDWRRREKVPEEKASLKRLRLEGACGEAQVFLIWGYGDAVGKGVASSRLRVMANSSASGQAEEEGILDRIPPVEENRHAFCHPKGTWRYLHGLNVRVQHFQKGRQQQLE